MNAIDTQDINTTVGTYRIKTYYDENSFNPLTDYDHEGMELYIYRRGQRWGVEYEDWGSTEAGKAMGQLIYRHGGYDGHDVVRRMNVYKAITGQNFTFKHGSVQRFNDVWHYFAIVAEGSDFTYPEKAIDAVINEYADWAIGSVYGVVVEGPDGEVVDSCWGFIGEESLDDALDKAKAYIENDVLDRLEQVNKGTAGFVGII